MFPTHNIQFTIKLHYKIIQVSLLSAPTESYVIIYGLLCRLYFKLPYNTLYSRVILVAGGETHGCPRLRLSPLPFPSALLSLLILQPHPNSSNGDEPNISSSPWIFLLVSSSRCNSWRVAVSLSVFVSLPLFEPAFPSPKVASIVL